MTNTRYTNDYENHGDQNFPTTGKRIAWDYEGRTIWSYLYTPTAEAAAWDGAPVGCNAVGNSFGSFGYVVIKVTGRKQVRVPRTDVYGLKVKATFDPGTADACTLDAWIVD